MKVSRAPSHCVTSLLHHRTTLLSQNQKIHNWQQPINCPPRKQRLQPCIYYWRTYSTESSQVSSRSTYRTPSSSTLNAGAVARIQKEFILDEDINGKWIRVKDQETGKLKQVQTLISVLSTIDRDKEVVHQLQASPGAPIVVEVTTRDALNERLQAKDTAQAAQAKTVRESKPKQIELNWAISGHDLDMKMKQLRDFVEKGKRVEVLLAVRRKQRRATPEEAQNVVKHIRQVISEIDKCKEIIPMEGSIGGQAMMTIQKLKS